MNEGEKQIHVEQELFPIADQIAERHNLGDEDGALTALYQVVMGFTAGDTAYIREIRKTASEFNPRYGEAIDKLLEELESGS